METVDIQKIFVGRQKELETMKAIWTAALDMGHEHKAYVIFNSPGVGKSTLIKKFGTIIENEEVEYKGKRWNKGFHFHYVCNNEFKTRSELHQDILKELIKSIEDKENLILKYIDENIKTHKKELHKKRLSRLELKLEELIDTDLSMGVLNSQIKDLANIIPIFFSSDEVQKFEQQNFSADDRYPEESVFHYYTRIISAFLNSKVLLVMTGTQYHILKRIGNTIGSPIKVEPRVISPLSENDLKDYIVELNKLFPELPSKLLKYLHKFLKIYSGGHARTIEYTVKEVVGDYLFYTKIDDYNEFMEKLKVKMDIILVNTLLSTEKINAVKSLQSSVYFTIIHDWYVRGIFNNLNLGAIPYFYDKNNEAIRDIVYKMMTTGILVENGNNDYHITSYFHYLIYMRSMTEEYEQFLYEVLNNKYFERLVGYHSGFGFVFEYILLVSLLYRKPNEKTAFKIYRSKALEVIETQIDYKSLELKQEIIYHTPATRNIDAIMQTENELLVLQITTEQEVKNNKIIKFAKEIERIELETGKKVVPWFISLFHVRHQIPEKITLIHDVELREILGKEIYERLVETKQNL